MSRKKAENRLLPHVLVVVLLWILSGPIRAESPAWLRLVFQTPPLRVQVDSLQFAPARRDTLLSLPAGTHTVLAQAPRRQVWNQRDFRKVVSLKAGDTLTVRVEFPRYLLLATSPAGAAVEQNGIEWGKTPLLILAKKLQQAPILLKKAGYLPRVVQPKQIDTDRLWVELQPDSGFWAQEKEKQRRQKIQRRRLYQKAIGMAVVAAGSGVASYLFKQKANRLYDHYLHTPFPGDIRNSYDEAHKYDTYAGSSYIFFEMNLIGSTYFILKLLSLQNPEGP